MERIKVYGILTVAAYILTDKVERSCTDGSGYVADFMARNYGEESVNDGIAILRNIMQQDRILYKAGREDPIYNNLRQTRSLFSDSPYEERMRLLAFFIGLALEKWGYNGVGNEMEKLHNIAMLLGLAEDEVDMLLGMLFPFSGESPKEKALRILGLPVNATEDDIKSAYRRLSLK